MTYHMSKVTHPEGENYLVGEVDRVAISVFKDNWPHVHRQNEVHARIHPRGFQPLEKAVSLCGIFGLLF